MNLLAIENLINAPDLRERLAKKYQVSQTSLREIWNYYSGS